ncbi:MAG: PKD domain-containing protein, partial [Flavobacteriales bacterium]|nr:PKD domain-containing protein [Flavobacteriales bacterium]
KDYNLRLFYYYLTELLENYTHESPRMLAWLEAEENASRSYSINDRTYTNWFRSRERYGLNVMRRYIDTPFRITTQDGTDFETDSDALELRGESPPGIFAVQVEGQPDAAFRRSRLGEWILSNVRLREGANTLNLLGVDQWGKVLDSTQIQVTRTSNGLPDITLDAKPASWNIDLDQSLKLDAGDSFDPEGDPLQFTWSAPQQGIQLTEDPPTRATALFTVPGWYDITVSAQDGAGNERQEVRQASVYGRHGFSNFSGIQLDPWWTVESGRMVDNRLVGSRFSLEEKPGHLTMRITHEEAHNWTDATPSFPHLSRQLPDRTDWSLHGKFSLDSNLSRDFWTGMMVTMNENGNQVR